MLLAMPLKMVGGVNYNACLYYYGCFYKLTCILTFYRLVIIINEIKNTLNILHSVKERVAIKI